MDSTEFTPEELVENLIDAATYYSACAAHSNHAALFGLQETKAKVIAALRAVPGRGESVPPQGAGASATEPRMDAEDSPSVRDQFAMAALQGFCANPSFSDTAADRIAVYAEEQADECMNLRATRKGTT